MSKFIAVVGDSSYSDISKGNHTIGVESLLHAVEFVNGIIEASISEGTHIKNLTAKIIDTETVKVVVQSVLYGDALQVEASAPEEVSRYVDIPHRVVHRGNTSFGVWYKD